MLTLRLNAILNYIESSDTVADIGTDHGYLLEACLKKGVKFVCCEMMTDENTVAREAKDTSCPSIRDCENAFN